MTMHGETMIANYKIIDDGIWLSYDELKRMYAAKIEELKDNDESNISITKQDDFIRLYGSLYRMGFWWDDAICEKVA